MDEIEVCGEAGIRTLGTQKAQRFSRPPDSTTLAPLLKNDFSYRHLIDEVFERTISVKELSLLPLSLKQLQPDG